MGHHVSVICGEMDNNTLFFKDGDVNVYPIIGQSTFSYYLSKIPFFCSYANAFNYLISGLRIHLFLRNLNCKIEIDIIEYTEGGDFWNSIIKKFRYFSHLHGSAFTFKQNSDQQIYKSDVMERKLEHYFIKNAEKVISPCIAMRKIVESEMEIKLNARVIPYPIHKKYFHQILDESYGLKKSKIYLLFASRNDPVKGGEFFINALKQLNVKYRSVIRVDFYGYKPQQDITNLQFLKTNEFVPIYKLNRIYKKADICVVPSLFDNSPNTVYEAMASGKVIIASTVGGIPEIIGGPENGFLFDIFSPDDLTKKLTEAIELVLSGNDIKLRKNAQQRIRSIAHLHDNTLKRLKLIRK
jgi:glycosyltransferase involved in cell wall biosynthesis